MTDDSLDGLDFESLNADAETTAAAIADNKPSGPPQKTPSETRATTTEDDLPPLDGVAPKKTPRAAKSRKRPLWEVLSILGAVFLVAGLFAWILMAFFFAEKPESETTLELPRNRMEAMLMELPVGKIQSHQLRRSNTGSKKTTVFIVEIDASVIVKGTSGELVEVESLLKSHHSRIEEVIEETIRSASDANLNEPETIVIRTRIRDRINAYFDRPLVKEVLFSHYRAFHTPIKQ